MSGYPEFNYPEFNALADRLRNAGLILHNPAENLGGNTALDRERYMRHDIHLVLESDALLVHGEWQRSQGATLEVGIAWAAGIPVYHIWEGERGHLMFAQVAGFRLQSTYMFTAEVSDL
jgi:nucleoside 2-deoxyribosyltransferase